MLTGKSKLGNCSATKVRKHDGGFEHLKRLLRLCVIERSLQKPTFLWNKLCLYDVE